MCKVYGYCRISRKTQSIERQIRNIKSEYPEAVIIPEAYTGTKINRPAWNKLYKTVKEGDTIIFDSVSRMSRNADEGVRTYFELYDKGIKLVFLKERYIDTATYKDNTADRIPLQGVDEDEIFIGMNNYFRKIAAKQIRIAFEQAEKEVKDLRQRTKEGLREVKNHNEELIFKYGSEEEAMKSPEWKQQGQRPGAKLNVKKAIKAKEIIMKHSKDFDGTLSDPEVIKLAGVSRNTYYKYKAEIKA